MNSKQSVCNSALTTSKKQSIEYLAYKGWHSTQTEVYWNEVLMAKLKMPVTQLEELISSNNKLIEADEKFCMSGKKQTIKLINISNKTNPKPCCTIKEWVLLSSAKPILYNSKCWLPTRQEYWSTYWFVSNHFVPSFKF